MSDLRVEGLEQNVITIVAEALGLDPKNVKLHSSLKDDLGAESIDLIDIAFRLQSEYDLLIPENELWAGSMQIDPNDPEALRQGVAGLREKMPDFPWARFSRGVTKRDLPRLTTVSTIIDYLRKRIETPPERVS